MFYFHLFSLLWLLNTTMLIRSGENGHSWLVPSFSPLSMLLLVGLSHIAVKHSFPVLGYVPPSLNTPWISSKDLFLFLHHVRSFCNFCLWVSLCDGYLLLIYWIIPTSLEWRQFGHDESSFWYDLEFCLPAIYFCTFIHQGVQCIISFLLLLCLYLVWCQGNTGFVRIAGSLYNFLKII